MKILQYFSDVPFLQKELPSLSFHLKGLNDEIRLTQRFAVELDVVKANLEFLNR